MTQYADNSIQTSDKADSRYRKIYVKIWNDQKFRGLSDRGKLVFIFILTHPGMTSLGAMRATINGLAAELSWEAEAFRKAFEEASVKGMLEADESASFIAAPNFVKFNLPESPNVIRAWKSSVALIPECDHLSRLIQRVKGFVAGMSEGFRKAFAEAFPQAFDKAYPHPSPNQEPEQEQEPEKNQEQKKDLPAAPVSTEPPAAAVPPVMTFAINHRKGDPAEWHLHQDYLDELAEAFEGIDVHNECRKALIWMKSTPGRKKTARGMKSFLFGWMSRCRGNGTRAEHSTDESTGFSRKEDSDEEICALIGGPHVAEIVRHFKLAWANRYEGDYQFVSKDGPAPAAVLKAAGDDVKKAIQIIDRFMDCNEQFIVNLHHPFALLASQINRFTTNSQRHRLGEIAERVTTDPIQRRKLETTEMRDLSKHLREPSAAADAPSNATSIAQRCA